MAATTTRASGLEKRGAAGVDHHQGEREQKQSGGNDGPAARLGARGPGWKWRRARSSVPSYTGRSAGFSNPTVFDALSETKPGLPKIGVRSQALGRYAGGTAQPFGLAGISVIDGVEDEFDAGGDAEFFEDAEKIFLDGVLAEVEFAGNLAIAEAFGDEGDDLFLARGEQAGRRGS